MGPAGQASLAGALPLSGRSEPKFECEGKGDDTCDGKVVGEGFHSAILISHEHPCFSLCGRPGALSASGARGCCLLLVADQALMAKMRPSCQSTQHSLRSMLSMRLFS